MWMRHCVTPKRINRFLKKEKENSNFVMNNEIKIEWVIVVTCLQFHYLLNNWSMERKCPCIWVHGTACFLIYSILAVCVSIFLLAFSCVFLLGIWCVLIIYKLKKFMAVYAQTFFCKKFMPLFYFYFFPLFGLI